MDLIVTILSLVMLLVITKLGVKFRQRKLTQEQLHSVLNIQRLLQLIGSLQNFRQSLFDKQQSLSRVVEISRQVNQQKDLIHEEVVFSSHDRWLGFIDHWSRLKEKAQTGIVNSEQAVHQFDSVLSNLLQLVEELADSASLNKYTLVEFPNINLLWREIPLLIENTRKIMLLYESENLDIASPQQKRKIITMLKLVLKLSRVSMHHVRYNGVPCESKESLLTNALSYSNLLQQDLNCGALQNEQTSPVFIKPFMSHLQGFGNAFEGLLKCELEMLKKQVASPGSDYIPA